MSPVPILTLLLLLMSSLGGISGLVYLPHVIRRASTPITTFNNIAITQCAYLCRTTEGCIKWSHDPETRLCQLWPLHSAENPLTASAEPLYQTVLPEGFILSDDPTIAYRQRGFSLIGGNESIIASCTAYDPDSFPAFPNTEQQISYIKANVIGSYYWIGIWDQETEGVFKDMTTGQVVELPPAWWWNGVIDTSTSTNCMTLYGSGLWAVNCDATYNGHICQYNVQSNGRRPLAE